MEQERKKLAASVYFKAELKTTMLSWQSKFDFFYLPVFYLSVFFY